MGTIRIILTSVNTYNNPLAIAVDPASGDCYVGEDADSGRVYRIDARDGSRKVRSPDTYDDIKGIAVSPFNTPPIYRERPGTWEVL